MTPLLSSLPLEPIITCTLTSLHYPMQSPKDMEQFYDDFPNRNCLKEKGDIEHYKYRRLHMENCKLLTVMVLEFHTSL